MPGCGAGDRSWANPQGREIDARALMADKGRNPYMYAPRFRRRTGLRRRYCNRLGCRSVGEPENGSPDIGANVELSQYSVRSLFLSSPGRLLTQGYQCSHVGIGVTGRTDGFTVSWYITGGGQACFGAGRRRNQCRQPAKQP